MSSIELQKPFLEGGTRSINFFNGRLLTAEDLSTERDVNRLQHQQLGQAIGAGIVTGLQVQLSAASSASSTTYIVTVTGGQALNRQGQMLSLPNDVDVVRVPVQTPGAADAGMFAVCDPPTVIPVFTGYGAYILVFTPASGFEGRAPVNGVLPGDVTRASCGSRYIVEGVKFGLVKLDIATLPNISQDTRTALAQLMTQSDPVSLSMLRNRLAHLCFGTEELGGFLSDPFRQVNGGSPYIDVGALAALRTQGKLTDCDVPLALLYWTKDGIQFVDMGSVRHRPVLSAPTLYQLLNIASPVYPNFDWSIASASNSLTIGEAASAQFQEHMEWLAEMTLKTAQSQTFLGNARNYFRYLPAVGILPVTGAKSTKGFVPANFFKDIPLRYPLDDGTQSKDPPTIEGAKVAALVREAFAYPPIKLEDQNNLANQEMIWIYQVRENQQAIAEALVNAPQPYHIFTSGHVPYRGYAQYDIAHWSYGTIASLLDR